MAPIAFALPLLAAGERTFERIPENTAGAEALKGGVNPWHYWGTCKRNPQLVQPAWRDREGYETQPSVGIPHAIEKWWLHDPSRRYDYVARTGKRVGFAVDDRFLNGRHRVAVKVSFYDGFDDTWRIAYKKDGNTAETAPVKCTATDVFRTATFFIDADFDANTMSPPSATAWVM
jgi:hypothetical protein